MYKVLYLGMPGSGKTTTLLNLLEKELEHTPPEKIAYVSFTKKAISEAQNRAVERFHLSKKQMPFFKTLHALAFAALGMSRSDVVSDAHLRQLSQDIGVDLTDKDKPFQPLALYNLARVKGKPLIQVWQETYSTHTQTWDEINHIVARYVTFKRQNNLYDFTDMLILFNKQKNALPVSTVFVDEAQDLSTIQWQMLDIAFADAQQMILAGDDDQCIYEWSGADKERFLKFEGEKIILDKSYRCPQVVADFANQISRKIKPRFKKTLYGHADGQVVQINTLEAVLPILTGEQETLILVRNRAHVFNMQKVLMYHSVPFTVSGKNIAPFKHVQAIQYFSVLKHCEKVSGIVAENIAECSGLKDLYFDHDAEYSYVDIYKRPCATAEDGDFRLVFKGISNYRLAFYYSALKWGARFKVPGIHVSTIHGAKGSEYDNVVLCCDQSVLTFKAAQREPGNEHRVFYVGATRAKKNLFLLTPTKKRHYKMPLIAGV